LLRKTNYHSVVEGVMLIIYVAILIAVSISLYKKLKAM